MTRLPAIPLQRPGDSPCLANGCARCCHDTEMLLTEDDVRRLAVANPDVDFAFRAGDGYLQLRTRDAPPVPGHEGKPCVFLAADGRCTVWEQRPEGCRLYPGLWDDELRRAHLDDAVCPHTGGFALVPHTADAVRRLATRLHAERDARVARG